MSRLPPLGLLLGALLLVVVIAALLWLSSGGMAPVGTSARAAGAQNGAPDGASSAATADAAAAPRAPVADDQRRALATTADAPALAVHVVRKATQQPVPGAEVFAAAASGDEHGTLAIEAAARRDGAPVVTDGNGDATLAAAAATPLFVFCGHDGLWAEVTLFEPPPRGEPVLLQLDADLALRVLVLGPDARPVAGVPVTVAGTDRMHGRELLLGMNLEQRTGADGIAAFAHLQARVQTPSAVVLLDLPLPERVLQNVELAALPRDPLVLHLPATGALTVQLVDDRGPFQPEGFVRIQLEDRTAGEQSATKHEYAMRKGRLELPHLALSRRLFATVVSEYCTGSQAIAGPTRAGERTDVALAVHRQPMLTGRLVDERHAPLRRESWQAVYAAGEWTSYHVWFETDGDGRFRMPLPPVFAAGSERLAVLVPADDARTGLLMARVELPEWVLRDSRDVDLGDVVAALPPVLVDGTVVDEGGRPVAGVALRVQQHRDGIRETAVDTHATSAADGTFAVRAVVPQDGLHLVAELSRRQSQDIPFTAGARNLTVVMPATGRVECAVQLDDGLPLRLLLASCTDGSGATTTMGSHLAIRGGTLAFDDLPPGSVTLLLRPVGETEPVWRADAVPVRGGETTTLPGVDLRGRLHAVLVRTVDDEQRPVLEATARLDPDRPGAREQPRAHDGRIELLLHRAVTVAVHAPGRASALLPALERDATAVLHAGLSLVLQSAEPPPPPPLRVRAVLEASGPAAAADARDRQWRDGGDRYDLGDGRALLGATSAPLDADRRAAIVVPAPGAYRLRWRIERGGDVRWVDGVPAQLTIDGATAGVVPVSLPADALAAALREGR